MKTLVKSISTVLLAGIVLSGCSDKKEGVPVEGVVENVMEDGYVTLARYNNQTADVIDTIEVNQEGEFEFNITQDQPSFYRLNFYDRQIINLIINGTEEKVTLNLDGTDPQDIPEITGSIDTDYLNNLVELVSYQNKELQKLNQEAIQARMAGEEDELRTITKEYYDRYAYYQEEKKDMIWKITPSLAAYYALSALDMEQYFSFYDSVAQRIAEVRPNHPTTKELLERIGSMKTLAVGSEAPEISLPNPDGKVVTLSSLRGNYVLVDFWAAWCKPCRVENPNVVRLYNQYKDQNFEILGVSLDRTKEAWVKAIDQDGLTWKHVSDLKYFNSEAANTYQINAIPATYLIGPDGKIIAKNLRGASLEAKLKEIFG